MHAHTTSSLKYTWYGCGGCGRNFGVQAVRISRAYCSVRRHELSSTGAERSGLAKPCEPSASVPASSWGSCAGTDCWSMSPSSAGACSSLCRLTCQRTI